MPALSAVPYSRFGVGPTPINHPGMTTCRPPSINNLPVAQREGSFPGDRTPDYHLDLPSHSRTNLAIGGATSGTHHPEQDLLVGLVPKPVRHYNRLPDLK
ncbi:hypothetical protein BHE74_00037213 [Ensete ventricosum]|nr:hypothetical protein GW17_00049733 [Ensete ventricosum]RWW56096.1 hypothetical protein BHE74_00037213 [Ensete ventricosum]RZR89747.1 hypothetical protein BHM03_00017519 [Ensete ventricosum]